MRKPIVKVVSERRIREWLLLPWKWDHFSQTARLGGFTVLRPYWLKHHVSLMAEFCRRHPDRGNPVFPDGLWPLGMHQFHKDM
jgi:hypothetical protein